MKDEELILCFYLHTPNKLSEQEKDQLMEGFKNRVKKSDFNLKYKSLRYIFLATEGQTRIECINPIYVTDKKLVEEMENKIKTLNSETINEIKEINKPEGKQRTPKSKSTTIKKTKEHENTVTKQRKPRIKKSKQ